MAGVGIFNAVVEQRRKNRVGVQSHFRYNFRHGKGMDDIGRAVLSKLTVMLPGSILIAGVHQLHIHMRRIFFNGSFHCRIMFGY